LVLRDRLGGGAGDRPCGLFGLAAALSRFGVSEEILTARSASSAGHPRLLVHGSRPGLGAQLEERRRRSPNGDGTPPSRMRSSRPAIDRWVSAETDDEANRRVEALHA
jgi:hypothetical protein